MKSWDHSRRWKERMKVYPPPGLFQMQLLIVTLIITIKNHISTTINNDLKKKKNYVWKNLDQTWIYLRSTSMIQDWLGQANGAICSSCDISYLKNSEIDLKKTEQGGIGGRGGDDDYMRKQWHIHGNLEKWDCCWN